MFQLAINWIHAVSGLRLCTSVRRRVARTTFVSGDAGLFRLRYGVRLERCGGESQSESERFRDAAGRISFAATSNADGIRLLGWRTADGDPVRSERSGRMGVSRYQQPAAV